MKKINVDFNRSGLKDAEQIEDIICLTVLISRGALSEDSTIKDAERYYTYIESCNHCPYAKLCLACIINE